ncbi:Lrp/AsnC family transcriptional regulator [Planctobacterium marinum]|uniref:Lrp-family transcriptional regulator n=1 Tax=Planctobacterium marinum TaxID=1631968 RepID=A0AA48HS68_9ALTE|nr:Lrp-family transcriptional regulator [Planctobacterium marinum]
MAKKNIKLDAINKRILATIHKQADLSNQELAELVGLSPSACFQRTKALKEAGYFFNFHTEMDLERICEHMLAYVEVKLHSNTPQARKPFEQAIQDIPEFMDCLRVEGEFHYMMFSCFPNIQALNQVCDDIARNSKLEVKEIKVKTILERTKWYLGYPLEKLKWLE